MAASAFRLCDQLEEVSFTSSPVHGIPRFCHQLPRDEAFLANRENVPTSPGLQRPDLREERLSANSLSHYWETDFNFTSSPPSTPPLQAFTNATGKRLIGREGVQLGCSSKQGMPERSPVVDRPTVDLEWEVNNLTSPRFDYYDRCVLEGPEAVCQGVHTRGLWTREESLLHINALELKAALFALRAFSNNRKKLHVHLRMDNRTAVAYLLKMGGGHGLRG